MRQSIQKLKMNRFLSFTTLFIGTILLIYMIKVEDEPGALPLFLIVIGIIWLMITRYQIKKQNK